MNYDHIISTDGEVYINADDVREALGIGEDSESDIFEWIAFLKKSNERSHSEMYKARGEKHEFEKKIREALGIVDEYADLIGLVRKLKEERDQLKEKCDQLKKRANAAYGTSCGYSEYSGDKAPAFRCNVISYSWNFGPIAAHSLMDEPSYPISSDSIRVELDLTPTANYKGAFDLEDLKKYIQNYGREKKLGIIESVDYQNAKAARAELAYLYKTVVGKEKLDRDLSPHEVMKAILDEVKRLRDSKVISAEYLKKEFQRFCKEYTVFPITDESSIHDWIQYIFKGLADYRTLANGNFNKAEGFRKEKRALEDSLAELRAKIREIYRSVVDDEWDEHLSYTSAMNDINEEYKRVVHNFEERTADWSKVQKEYSRYRLAVDSLLDIPKDVRDDINAIERAFTFSKKKYESLKEFRDNVCEILDIPSSMADNYILKELHDFADRYDELEDFRADICGALDIEGMLGTPQQNDKYILEQVKKMKDDDTSLDRYARLRSNICTALCLGGETCDEDILKRVRMTKECHDALCKDYTELRKAIWEAMDRKPETLPDETARLVGEVRMLQLTNNDIVNRVKSLYDANGSNHDVISDLNRQVTELKRGEKLLIEFRDAVAEAIGMDYPTTNQVILTSVQYIYKDRKDAYELVAKINDQVTELVKAKEDLCELRRNAIEDLKSRGFCFRPEENETLPEIYDKLLKRYDWAYGEYKEQYRLRQMWHVRWESENERANGVQKALDREKAKCHVKDVALETAKKQYEKVCNNLETAECAINGMKSKVRSLQEEKTKVITALGQDILDDCVK